MDKNIGFQVPWINKADYLGAGGQETDYDETFGNNNKGPLTALTALEELTATWTNIPIMSYQLEDDNITPKYQPITRNNVRARMLTKTEATSLGCTNTLGMCPDYLYGNLSEDNTGGANFGYWLSTAESENSGFTWNIDYGGNYSSNYTANISACAVRPVITISKKI